MVWQQLLSQCWDNGLLWGVEGLIFHTSVPRNAVTEPLFRLFLWRAFSTLVISFFFLHGKTFCPAFQAASERPWQLNKRNKLPSAVFSAVFKGCLVI